MKHEIIIEPKNKEYCGNCTYKRFNLTGNLAQIFREWHCLLFDKTLVSWDFYDKEQRRPSRCPECKKLTTNFENMPELQEVR